MSHSLALMSVKPVICWINWLAISVFCCPLCLISLSCLLVSAMCLLVFSIFSWLVLNCCVVCSRCWRHCSSCSSCCERVFRRIKICWAVWVVCCCQAVFSASDKHCTICWTWFCKPFAVCSKCSICWMFWMHCCWILILCCNNSDCCLSCCKFNWYCWAICMNWVFNSDAVRVKSSAIFAVWLCAINTCCKVLIFSESCWIKVWRCSISVLSLVSCCCACCQPSKQFCSFSVACCSCCCWSSKRALESAVSSSL